MRVEDPVDRVGVHAKFDPEDGRGVDGSGVDGVPAYRFRRRSSPR